MWRRAAAACVVLLGAVAAQPVYAAGWSEVGSGRFSWGEHWVLRVQGRDGAASQCLNLVPHERRQRACLDAAEVVPTEEFEHDEDICRGRALAYGAVAPEASHVELRTRRGGRLATTVTFMPAPPALGSGLRYFVAEARTRRHRAHGWTRERLGSAVVRDVTGKALVRVPLSDNDSLASTKCR